MYDLGNYNGCGCCGASGLCGELKKEKVKIKFKSNEMADNWGRYVAVFRKGEEVEAEAIIDGNTVMCITATSKIYSDYTDFIDINNIELV